MANTILTTLKEKMTHRRFHRGATVVVFLLVIFLGLLALYCPKWAAHEVFAPHNTEKILEIKGEVMTESLPTRIMIPSLSIEAPFSEPLGLKANQQIEVPKDFSSVGYYKNGPTPGELGPAVILGHVDSVDGPAVFFSLGQLKEGDEIKIERADGSVAVFAVTALERHAQSGFPTKEVYGDIDHAGLRLITCTGVYIKDAMQYTHNLIVYAKLVSTSTTESN